MKKSFFFGALALIGLTGWRPAAAQSDLSITKTAPSSVLAGQNLTYTLKIANDGTAASNPALSDPLPAGTTFVSAQQTEGTTFGLQTPTVGQNGTVTANATSFSSNILRLDAGLIAAGNFVYFTIADQVNGRELWKSDGTAAGTGMVKAFKSVTVFPQAIGNTVYFGADDGVHGAELWKSNGTAAGTVLVQDINSGSAGSNPSDFTNVGGTIYFKGTDGNQKNELWKTDGTAAGTIKVKDFPAPPDGNLFDLTSCSGKLYFVVITSKGSDLWKSDGTTTGTVFIKTVDTKDINSPGRSLFHYLTNVNDTLYFQGYNAATGIEIWKSDGTASGTTIVKDINPGSSDSSASGFTLFNGLCYFSANDGSHGAEMWKTNGTSAGTTLVDINPGSQSSYANSFVTMGGKLYFSASISATGQELWTSDGTTAGTKLVKDIFPGSGTSMLYEPISTGSLLYFSAAEDGINTELWKSNGTAAGTVRVKDIRPGASGSSPEYLTNLNGTVFFRANGASGLELYKSNGTEAGTVPVRTSQVASFEVVVKVNKEWDGALTNTATVNSVTDFNSANNSASVTTNVIDTFKPTPTIDSPTENQSLTVAAFNTIKGKATDNVGVTQVLVKVLRNQNGTLQYWNGTAFTATSTNFLTTLANPGDKLTTWSYAISTQLKAALSTGPYLIYAYARDAAGNQSNALSRSFNITSDGIKPVPTISNPTEGQTLAINSFSSVEGSATDNVGATEVLIKVTRTRGSVLQYWNGSAFTPTSAYFQANLTAPGSTATTWNYAISSQLKAALDSGPYEVLAFARDGAGNQSNALSRKFTLTSSTKISAAEASNPSANSY